MSTTNFMGLTMPVFTAFGWAGEETAIKFALAQLELFISTLHVNLPRAVQLEFPVFGLSQDNQSVYLAASSEIESDVHIAFYARPMSLELQLVVTNKDILAKGLAAAEKNPVNCHHLITNMGPEWSLRLQQMLIEEESRVVSHYQDLFKESITQLSQETATAVFSKAAYLNGQEKWVTPIYLSRRFNSEQIAAMGTAVIRVMSEQIDALMPVVNFLTGRVGRKPGKTSKRTTSKARTGPRSAVEPVELAEVESDDQEGFVFVTDLKPLHLRRGFINMTPRHWEFFAVNARTETRNVSVYYDGIYDRKSAVWRLQPGDMARLVLGPAAHEWLEDHFAPNEQIQLKAIKLDNENIQISLTAVESAP